MSDYFSKILEGQELSPTEIRTLQDLCATIENQLSVLKGGPRFYCAGSYGKHTMIKERYDLDIVIYWPHDCGFNIGDIYSGVGETLKKLEAREF